MNFSSERWGGTRKSIPKPTSQVMRVGKPMDSYFLQRSFFPCLFNYLRRLRILFVLYSIESVFESAGGGVGLLLALLLYSHAVV